MKINSESIYGTTASPLGEVPWGRCTAKPGKLYLHVFDWPTNGRLDVPGLQHNVQKAYLLADKKRTQLPLMLVSPSEIAVTVPDEAPDRIDSVVVLEIKQ
jgi:alpha-L-fucosidase